MPEIFSRVKLSVRQIVATAFFVVVSSVAPKSFVLIGGEESATPYTFDKTLAYSRQLDVPRELPEDVIVYPMTTGDGRRLISYDVNGTAIRELVPEL